MSRALLVIATTLILAACGKQGALERPDPMFGKPAPGAPGPTEPAQGLPAK